MQIRRGVGEPITEGDTFVAGGEFEAERGVIGVFKIEREMIHPVVDHGLRTGEKADIFSRCSHHFTGTHKAQENSARNPVVIATQAER